jgi:3-phenylpropionate/trans-cinnamate dioxygenase ferredoxin reductase component
VSRPEEIVIVGASLAGWRAAEALRRHGFEGRLHLVGEERHLPYDRPPLSKQLLLDQQRADDLPHTDEGTLRQLGILFHPETQAVGVDRIRQRVLVEGGESLPYDALVIATGATPVRPRFRWLEGMHTLRTLEDSLALRASFEQRPRLVIVGAGFIGLEVASAARRHGLEVTMVGARSVPLGDAVGPVIGAAVAGLARRDGVRLLLGQAVIETEGDTRVERLRLSDGRRIPADLVLVGVGVRPNVGWLEESGLADKRGVVCDEFGQAAGDPHVYAAGDVAYAAHRGHPDRARVEHWTNAVEQGELVARNIVDRSSRATLEHPPYFWSDQFGTKIQMAGRYAPGARTEVVAGSVEAGSFVAVFTVEGETVGAVAFDEPRTFIQYRRHLTILERALAQASTEAAHVDDNDAFQQIIAGGRPQSQAGRWLPRVEHRSARHVNALIIARAQEGT